MAVYNQCEQWFRDSNLWSFRWQMLILHDNPRPTTPLCLELYRPKAKFGDFMTLFVQDNLRDRARCQVQKVTWIRTKTRRLEMFLSLSISTCLLHKDEAIWNQLLRLWIALILWPIQPRQSRWFRLPYSQSESPNRQSRSVTKWESAEARRTRFSDRLISKLPLLNYNCTWFNQ